MEGEGPRSPGIRPSALKDDIVRKVSALRFHYTGPLATGMDAAALSTTARLARIWDTRGLTAAAIHQLELQAETDEPVDEQAFDPELWAFVRGLVEDEDWDKVASQTAAFVESRVREWAGDPEDKHGYSLVGKGLYAAVFADESDWRLGARAGQREGWRLLGMESAHAIGNVDRHKLQRRDDARRYAVGVLGLGSLMLTHLRWEHWEMIKDASD